MASVVAKKAFCLHTLGNRPTILAACATLFFLEVMFATASLAPCLATTLNVPSEYLTIQAAVDVAADGDSIIVASGNYTEPAVQIQGKRLFIIGAGRDATFLSSAPAAGFVIFEFAHVSMTGFDITSGGGPGAAPSFVVDTSTVIINDSRIHNSNGGAEGGAIEAGSESNVVCSDVEFIHNSGIVGAVFVHEANNAHFTRCRFEGNFTNRSFNGAGAVHVSARDARFVDCDFIDNTSIAGLGGRVGGLFVSDGATCQVERCLFLGNQGTDCGAILVEYGATTTIWNCTIAGNTGKVISAIGVGISGVPGRTRLENSIVIANGPGPALDCVSGMLTVVCCDVWRNTDDTICPDGMDNISADPEFCGIDRWDLQSDSPCAGPNSPICGLIGARGLGCGVSTVSQATWGSIKARWMGR